MASGALSRRVGAMRTAHLGSFGYGNLGDELCLLEAMRAFPSAEAFAFSEDPEWTMRCVPGLAGTFFEFAGMFARQPRRVVVGGGAVGTRVYFRHILPHLARAQAELGSLCHVHNIGVARMGRAAEWLPERGEEALSRLASFTVRDPRSAELVMEWVLGLLPGLTGYPESSLPADPALAEALLPRGRPLLGISVTSGARIWRCLDAAAERVRALLARFPDHALVPVVSTIHRLSPEEQDHEGFRRFHASFCPERPVVAPELADPAFWRAEMTPLRLKGVIARLDALISQRKHNCIHAIGAGVPAIGLQVARDDSLRRTFGALAGRLAPGSDCLGLPDPPEAA
ncbi:MAG: polysaccharide pyruvyl transferase family protein [Acetobacteraceae bacterium]|nr:polysaccharide pyruvyl transferase family protein [Acetobacteraceae bacterium]MDW8398224.1 polysaccharide pyruvyl transferase family protein [Acetobacteraceae bacterium]